MSYRRGPSPLAIGAAVAVAAVMLSGTHGHHGHHARALQDMARRPVTTAGGTVGLGRQMAARYGWTGSQWTCLDELWTRESGWRWWAQNPTSTAYGIPQFLDSTWGLYGTSQKTSDAGTQISDGLKYLRGRYGSPCSAWAHETNSGWY